MPIFLSLIFKPTKKKLRVRALHHTAVTHFQPLLVITQSWGPEPFTVKASSTTLVSVASEGHSLNPHVITGRRRRTLLFCNCLSIQKNFPVTCHPEPVWERQDKDLVLSLCRVNESVPWRSPGSQSEVVKGDCFSAIHGF